MAEARDRYVFIKKLAEGGMADVFLARDTGQSPPKLCVVKQLLPELRTRRDHVGMFLDEADLAVRLAHPNIVRALDRGSGREGPFLVLEYLAGYDLDLVVERLAKSGGQMPWPLALHVISSVAEGMAYAHALTGPDGRPMNLVHRDLTPSNVFITFDGLVKVLDFGIARADERRTRTSTGMLKGKARYLAPELIEQKPADGRVDQFSLGAGLYEALTRKPLFSGENELAVIHAIIESRRPSLVEARPDLPSDVDAVFRRMTARARDDRFPSMSDVAKALRSVMPASANERLELAAFLREHFASEFEAHASLMARLAAASTGELRVSFERGTPLPAARLEPTTIGLEDVPVRARASPVPSRPEATAGSPEGLRPTVRARASPVPSRPALEVPASLEITQDGEPLDRRAFEADDPTVMHAPVELPLSAATAGPLTLPPDDDPLTLPALDLRPLARQPPASRAESRGSALSSSSSPSPSLRWLLTAGVVVAAIAVGVLWQRSGRVDGRPKGVLLVRSQPPGASIKLNGQLVSFKTPAALPDLDVGVYEVTLEHPDGQPTKVKAEVVAKERRTVDVELPPREALLSFRVNPAHAIATIDGRVVELEAGVGTSPPLSAGEHEVRVQAVGFRPYAAMIMVADGVRQAVDVVLEVDGAPQVDPHDAAR